MLDDLGEKNSIYLIMTSLLITLLESTNQITDGVSVEVNS